LIGRLVVLGFLLGLHVPLILLFERSSHRPASSVESPAGLLTVFIRPRIREAGEPLSVVDPAILQSRMELQLTTLQSADAALDVTVERNAAAIVVAPTLQENRNAGIQPYLRRAGLRHGEGATVVLRIEVSEAGAPTRVLVDTSSGSRQIDEAAVEFARAQHWYAGRISGRPHSMWIRWGVRLQA
jgi:TonB family protein